jgi:hypothetical protein
MGQFLLCRKWYVLKRLRWRLAGGYIRFKMRFSQRYVLWNLFTIWAVDKL